MKTAARVQVPATGANLGPGFDALGLALNLFNEAEFTLRGDARVIVHIEGEGAGRLPSDAGNAVAQAALRVFARAGQPSPGLEIACHNRIPLGSGMGSSAAAVLTGLLGANTLLERPFDEAQILQMAVEAEGHPDNVAPALLGGLVVSISTAGQVVARKLPPYPDRAPIFATVVLPNVDFPTRQARAVLPHQVAHEDAVFNLGRAVLVCEALRSGDMGLLSAAMEDRLHQPYRLPLIPGAQAAQAAAKKAGAAAVALSGAGPSLIAFLARNDPAIGQAMQRAFEAESVSARVFDLQPSDAGAQVST